MASHCTKSGRRLPKGTQPSSGSPLWGSEKPLRLPGWREGGAACSLGWLPAIGNGYSGQGCRPRCVRVRLVTMGCSLLFLGLGFSFVRVFKEKYHSDESNRLNFWIFATPLIVKIRKKKKRFKSNHRAGGVAQVVKGLPFKCKALNWNPSTNPPHKKVTVVSYLIL
jgi:hypothetical protein